MSSLQGKVALVTGASKGIGAAIALEFGSARRRCRSQLFRQQGGGGQSRQAEIEDAGGKAIAIQANLADPESIGPLVATVAKKLGPINVLVNDAGIYDFSPLKASRPRTSTSNSMSTCSASCSTTQAALSALQPCRRQHHRHRVGRRLPGAASDCSSLPRPAVTLVIYAFSKRTNPKSNSDPGNPSSSAKARVGQLGQGSSLGQRPQGDATRRVGLR